MKLTVGLSEFSDETLRFCQQFGVTHLKINGGQFMDEHQRGPIRAEALRDLQAKLAPYGLRIGVALLPQAEGSQHWNIRLGLPGRENEIKDVQETLRILGGEGVPVVEYVFNLAAVAGSSSGPFARGAAVTRHYDHAAALKLPPVPEWASSADEVWERIGYFLEAVVPVAEQAGVRLACHPDDPPVPYLRGETRVLGTIEGLKRLIERVPSPANGLNFCQGTIAEMGVDVIETIRYFGSRDKINHVHFRNVRGALPCFDETFIDEGDTDMVAALRAYKEVGYTGTIMPDHSPLSAGDTPWRHRGRAYALGYIKALLCAVGATEN